VTGACQHEPGNNNFKNRRTFLASLSTDLVSADCRNLLPKEHRLKARFGQEYETYLAQTRRWL
jgi:hypothetical protein